MSLDFSDRRLLAAGLALMVVVVGFGGYLLFDYITSEEPIPQVSVATGAFSLEVLGESVSENGEEIEAESG
tara:strand:- start:287 stop:499 length:213 start_codon:yes stop_codon:yes gene_type:complete